jgi:hypothetical protein
VLKSHSISFHFARFLSTLRTIFPLLVFGNSEIIKIFLSETIGQISFLREVLSSCSKSVFEIFFLSFKTKNPKSASQVNSSGIQTSAHSAIFSFLSTMSSTSAIQILCPEIFITSSILPVIKIYPSLS